jgi:solute carrier family 25 (mitochondrial phosphate transporter), member 23/24/25/41
MYLPPPPPFSTGDVSLSAEDKPPVYLIYRPPAIEWVPPIEHVIRPSDTEDVDDNEDNDLLLEGHHHIEDDHHGWLGGTTALKYLAAGGVAGAGQTLHAFYQLSSSPISLSTFLTTRTIVSRTATAPFDRLKVFLIIKPPDLGGTSLHPGASVRGANAIMSAIARIYAEGGIAAFWVGNGLSVAKIFPESAIKFLTYEASVCLVIVVTADVHDLKRMVYRNAFLLNMWTM